jgi:putative NIF3 family GTP cyclohydrolase 1 type 2
MQTKSLSRRELAQFAGAAMVAGGGVLSASGTGAPTARQVIERIQKNIGVPWQAKTVDTFKAGNPDTPVRGIATSFMGTLDVLQRAAGAGKNLIISHEPIFYNHLDLTKDIAADPIYRAKVDFIEKHKLVVWRFHDHWHARQPDAVYAGLVKLLGWDSYGVDREQMFYALPRTTLGALASAMQAKLKTQGIRVIGDPSSPVSKVALAPGAAGPGPQFAAMPQADVYVCGEATEWEGIAYARDTIAAGQHKGMILIGHVVSEEPGMGMCAEWLKQLVPEVPVEWIPAGDPFWRPA